MRNINTTIRTDDHHTIVEQHYESGGDKSIAELRARRVVREGIEEVQIELLVGRIYRTSQRVGRHLHSLILTPEEATKLIEALSTIR